MRLSLSKITSLTTQVTNAFTRRQIQVLMLEDFPSVGFEGQVVNVQPGYARQALLPRKLAVYNFPGTRERLFPNIRQADIDAKQRFYRDLTNFQNKLENIFLEFVRVPSFANPSLLKEEITKKEIIREVANKQNIELKNDNVIMDENITRFGTYSITVRDFFNSELQKKFEFTVQVQVKQPAVREAREEKKDTPKEKQQQKQQVAASSKEPAKGGKEAKGGKDKEAKGGKDKDAKGGKDKKGK